MGLAEAAREIAEQIEASREQAARKEAIDAMKEEGWSESLRDARAFYTQCLKAINKAASEGKYSIRIEYFFPERFQNALGQIIVDRLTEEGFVARHSFGTVDECGWDNGWVAERYSDFYINW